MQADPRGRPEDVPLQTHLQARRDLVARLSYAQKKWVRSLSVESELMGGGARIGESRDVEMQLFVPPFGPGIPCLRAEFRSVVAKVHPVLFVNGFRADQIVWTAPGLSLDARMALCAGQRHPFFGFLFPPIKSVMDSVDAFNGFTKNMVEVTEEARRKHDSGIRY